MYNFITLNTKIHSKIVDFKNLISVSFHASARISFPSLVLLHVINFPIIKWIDFPVISSADVASVVPSRVLKVAVLEQPQCLWFHVLNVIHYVKKHAL